MAEVRETVPPKKNRSTQQKNVAPSGILTYAETLVTAGGVKKEEIKFDASKLYVEDGGDYVSENAKNITIRMIKQLIEILEAYKCEGKRFVSFALSPDDDNEYVMKLLDDRVNVAELRALYPDAEGALKSARQILGPYGNVLPANGLVICAGTVFIDDKRQKHITITFEPVKLIYMAIRRIIDRFDVMELTRLVEPEPKYGFIVMAVDKGWAIFGMLSGNKKKVLRQLKIEVPRMRLSRNQTKESVKMFPMKYLGKVVDLAQMLYFDASALVVAVSPTYEDAHTYRLRCDLRKKIICVGEVSSFNEAIARSSKSLYNVRYFQEIRLLTKFMKEIGEKTNTPVFGVEDTLRFLEVGAVKMLIVWENLGINRYVLKNTTTGKLITRYLNEEQEANQINFQDLGTTAKLEVQEKKSLPDWLAQMYNKEKFQCILEFVSDSSGEGTKFSSVFGGIGAILKYKYVFGVEDTLKCLKLRAVNILIVWENLDINPDVLKNTTRKLKEQEANQSNFQDRGTNAELEVQEKKSLLDSLGRFALEYGCTKFVTHSSPNDSQFCKNFCGIVGILHDLVDIQPYMTMMMKTNQMDK